MSGASNTTPICRCPFSGSNLMIPSTNFSHIINISTPETSPNPRARMVNINLYIQKWYMLYVQPVRDFPPVTLNEGYCVSPKFTCKFKIPLVLLHPISTSRLYGTYVSQELLKLPINSDLAQYLKPHIMQNVFAETRRSFREFNIVFDIKVVKIDLANYQECDSYRNRNLI
ncbi:hypothetical protein SESBI_09093 [Sesbania bispinosa]|nr:hypothetical protein SESBI_09093 [Sesbania bispinosa]